MLTVVLTVLSLGRTQGGFFWISELHLSGGGCCLPVLAEFAPNTGSVDDVSLAGQASCASANFAELNIESPLLHLLEGHLVDELIIGIRRKHSGTVYVAASCEALFLP